MNHMPDKQFVEMLHTLARKQLPCKMGHRVDTPQYQIMKRVVISVLDELRHNGSKEEYMKFDKWVREVMPTYLAPDYVAPDPNKHLCEVGPT